MNLPVPADVEKMHLLAAQVVAINQHRLPNDAPGSTMKLMSAHAEYDDRLIVAARRAKETVDPVRPGAFLIEREMAAQGRVEEVATIFLTNRECPFRCVFCDLWRKTTDDRVPLGAIPAQIDYALARLPAARHVKLYNSGNFFDRQAIPPEDYRAIADRVAGFDTVIVENHPKLCGPACIEFRDLLREARARQDSARVAGTAAGDAPKLEIALGLETVHPVVLPRLNKQMTLDDFQRAAAFLTANEIALRAFVLLRPPFMPGSECVDWALRSIEFAFDCGVETCTVIPTRSGNGIMERLEREGLFSPPGLNQLEETLARGLALRGGRVFVDLWDIEPLLACLRCGPARRDRLARMNLSQEILPAIVCSCT
jgi:hypothetical protein